MPKIMKHASGDMISGLPDAILGQILSHLPTKAAARTSVLSRRWRYLLNSVHNVDFDESEFPDTTTFIYFVDRYLEMTRSFRLKKFTLKLVNDVQPVHPDWPVRWIQSVLRRGVTDLYLAEGSKWVFVLPSQIFSCKTLVSLRIDVKGYLDDMVQLSCVQLPNLKTLYLESIQFDDGDHELVKILSGCPVLEELVMNCCSAVYTISHVNLKSVTICRTEEYDGVSYLTFSIDTPKLSYLDYTDLVAHKYGKVYFGSLREAKVDIRMTDDEYVDYSDVDYDEDSDEDYDEVSDGDAEELADDTTAGVFIKGFVNIRILYLSANTMEVLQCCFKQMPIFTNLTRLTIESKAEISWRPLPLLIKRCPNLDTLVFVGLRHRATSRCGDICLCKCRGKVENKVNSTCLSASPVKVVEIFKFEMDRDVEQLKYFMKTMPCLNVLIIHCQEPIEEEELKLLQMARVESLCECRIEVISENHT